MLQLREPIKRAAVLTRFASSSVGGSVREQLALAKHKFGTNKSIAEKIDTLEQGLETYGTDNYCARIGVLSSDPQLRNLLSNVLLCDPLDFKHWYAQLTDRPTDAVNVIKYGAAVDVFESGQGNLYRVPSPLLSGELRPAYHSKIGGSDVDDDSALDRSNFRDIELVEISTEEPTLASNPAAVAVEGVSELKLVSKPPTTVQGTHNCDLIIYVKASSGDIPESRFASWPIISVLDSGEVETVLNTPTSDIVVDLKSANRANEVLMASTANSTEFLALTRRSNINSLFYQINKQTSGSKPLVSLLKCLVFEMYSELGSAGSKMSSQLFIDRLMAKLDDRKLKLAVEIQDWAQRSHLELQSKLIPFLENEFIYSYGKIHRIMLNVDEYDLVLGNALFSPVKPQSGWFSAPIGAGYLSSSQTRFDYLLGKVDSVPSEISSDEYVTSGPSYTADESPIETVKRVAIDEKLPNLQKQVNSSILANLAKVNLPVFFVCSLLNLYGHIDLNTGAAIFLLSGAITLNNISNDTGRYLESFKTWYVESLRKSIDESKAILQGALESKIESTKTRLSEKFQVVCDLENSVRDQGI